MIRRSALVVLLLIVSLTRAAQPEPLVTVGEVTDRGAVLWLRGDAAGPVTVRFRVAGAERDDAVDVQVSHDADLTAKVPLDRLRAATRYQYTVSQSGAAVTGEFVTAPALASATPIRFAWSGDLGSTTGCRHVTDGYPIFRALASYRVDFFLFAGDTIYGDHICAGPDRVRGSDFVARTLDEYRAKHRYNREAPDVQAYFRTSSVYAIWDDHEVKNDFSGPSEPLMPIGRRAFLDYFPIQPPVEEPERLYRKFRWGRLLEVFILDTRQYRSRNTEPDGPAKTMLGKAQKGWLVESVTKSDAIWKVVVTSVPLSVPTGTARARDSWTGANRLGFTEDGATGFAMERAAILRMFRDRGVKNLVFLACDVHHAEVVRHHPTPDWSFHEFIAGPLSASPGRPRPLDMALNSRSLFALGGVENFGEVSIDPAGLTVRIVDVNRAVRFTHTIPAER